MKRLLLMLFGVCLATLVFTTGCEKNDEEKIPEVPGEEVKSYDVLGLEELPVGLWVTPPAPYQTTEEYARIKECGLNFVNGFSFFENSNTKIIEVLNYCEENGLKYFANKASVASDIRRYADSADKSLITKFINGIKPYAEHPAFAGELLIDEPGKNLFSAVAAFTAAFEKAYPEKMWHVNLFPTYATGGIQSASYNEYISSWLQTVPSKHISYDSYPLLTNGSIIDDYFYNLDIIRAKSRFKKIPFWIFIQTLSIAGTPGVPDKREPSEDDIRWQVWSNLAFGAKGIQYFCYWSPGNGTEQFGDALIDGNGVKTIRYDYVKKINADISSIGKILLEYHPEGVILTSVKDYKMYERLYDFGKVESVSGDDNIVGCFENEKGDRKMLITPLTPKDDANVTLHLSGDASAVKVWKNSLMEERSVVGSQVDFNISAGEAILIEII